MKLLFVSVVSGATMLLPLFCNIGTIRPNVKIFLLQTSASMEMLILALFGVVL